MFIGDRVRQKREQLGLTQTQLAERAGTSQQTVDRIESGTTKHSRALPSILEVLDIDAPERNMVRTRVVLEAIPHGPKTLPVFSSAQGGPGELQFSHDPIDYISRPEHLLGVKNGFAMYLVGDSMAPKYEQGDLILINPDIPYKINDFVLISRQLDGQFAAIVKRLVQVRKDTWVVKQYHPEKTFELPRADWPLCHVIVGSYNGR